MVTATPSFRISSIAWCLGSIRIGLPDRRAAGKRLPLSARPVKPRRQTSSHRHPGYSELSPFQRRQPTGVREKLRYGMMLRNCIATTMPGILEPSTNLFALEATLLAMREAPPDLDLALRRRILACNRRCGAIPALMRASTGR